MSALVTSAESRGANVDPQVQASDPQLSAFVTANAGSGKTWTLVMRVARLLLQGAPPSAILCLTYTKAAAAEMQSRLFKDLGDWAVMPDARLREVLDGLEEGGRDLRRARRLFAEALETPGGLKIQTIHGFCEALLRRFPVEAGVAADFTVLDDAAAAEVAQESRAGLAAAVRSGDAPELTDAYERLSVSLDFQTFEDVFARMAGRRREIAAQLAEHGDLEGAVTHLYNCCGAEPGADGAGLLEAAVTPPALDEALWRRAAQAFLEGGASDQKQGAFMAGVASGEQRTFDCACCALLTDKGQPRWAGKGPPALFKKHGDLHELLAAEQQRLIAAREAAAAAEIAADSAAALRLAVAWDALYQAAKGARQALDFADLTQRALELLTVRADAAWVLFKLDGGVDHLLVDEAQDTAPEQWGLIAALAGEFFTGAGARTRPYPRTVFAVGDEKQSIYSFQGARPERLRKESQGYASLTADAGAAFKELTLLQSRRSTPEVLRYVDAVFAGPDMVLSLMPGAEPPLDLPEHSAHRTSASGCVELWPLVEAEQVEAVPDSLDPVDYTAGHTANRRLADALAREVAAMLRRGDAVEDKRTGRLRPCRPGDVLFLVRRRSGVFHELIRALKRAEVPVAGADRLTLSDHIVFHDLLAVARVCLFGGDDLSLAAVLRSPLCDVDEQSLYDLAEPRPGDLWNALRARREERPEWARAYALLDWARRTARVRPPFELFSRLLQRVDDTGRSGRGRMLQRLGLEAQEALDAFLGQALAAEGAGAAALERLVATLSLTTLEVKREAGEDEHAGAGLVRVMTAHGAKGLEAPIVILPDTTAKALAGNDPVLDLAEAAFLLARSRFGDCPLSAEVKARRAAAAEAESLRLLYVALTRARDRLIVAGAKVRTKTGFADTSWYAVCQAAFDREPLAADVEPAEAQGLPIRRYGPAPQQLGGDARAGDAPALPAWALTPPAAERPALVYASPSQLEPVRSAAASPLGVARAADRFRRGSLIHLLLERLPDLPPADRPAAAARLLAREGGLDEAQRAEITAAAAGVLEDARFAPLFAPGSRAEAAVAGTSPELPPHLAVNGRLDRLAVTPGRVLVADYKTNRPAPDRIEDADGAYLTQMAVYVAVLRRLYPDRPVEAALVWTDGPRLMPIPEDVIAARLARLRGRVEAEATHA